jgi:hypothetical protein
MKIKKIRLHNFDGAARKTKVTFIAKELPGRRTTISKMVEGMKF